MKRLILLLVAALNCNWASASDAFGIRFDGLLVISQSASSTQIYPIPTFGLQYSFEQAGWGVRLTYSSLIVFNRLTLDGYWRPFNPQASGMYLGAGIGTMFVIPGQLNDVWEAHGLLGHEWMVEPLGIFVEFQPAVVWQISQRSTTGAVTFSAGLNFRF